MSLQQEYIARIERTRPYRWLGRVSKIIGLVVESNGPAASVGEMVEITGTGLLTVETMGVMAVAVLLAGLRSISFSDTVATAVMHPRALFGQGLPVAGATAVIVTINGVVSVTVPRLLQVTSVPDVTDVVVHVDGLVPVIVTAGANWVASVTPVAGVLCALLIVIV